MEHAEAQIHLRSGFDLQLAGEHANGSAFTRPYVNSGLALPHPVSDCLGELPDLSARITSFARHTARTVELTSPIYAIMTTAGTGAGEVHDLQRRLQETRFSGQRETMNAIARGKSLRPGLTIEDAADTFSALASPELHHILTAGRGWSQQHYANWLERTARSALLPI